MLIEASEAEEKPAGVLAHLGLLGQNTIDTVAYKQQKFLTALEARITLADLVSGGSPFPGSAIHPQAVS